MSDKIKLAIADDEVLFRKGIIFLLEKENLFEIIYEADNGLELIHFLETTPVFPDIVITDLKMPEMNGVEVTKHLNYKFPDLKIIALTSYNTPSFIANMIQVGASSYLVKNSTPDEVIKTIVEVHKRGYYYTEQVIQVIHRDILLNKGLKRTVLDVSMLTQRELEILKLICHQHTAIEIGEILGISQRTVENHKTNLLDKTNTKNIAGLVVFAFQNEIVNIVDIQL